MFLIYRNFEGEPGETIPLSDPERYHIRVRRLRKGDLIHVGDGISRRWQGRLSATLDQIERGPEEPEVLHEPVRILYTAIPDGKRWDWLLQKATELGVTSIIPVHYSRSVRQNPSEERSRRIIEEAAAQSRRFFLPELFPQITFGDLNRLLPEGTRSVVLHNLTGLRLHELEVDPSGSVALFVGPEGGMTDDEVSFFLSRGMDAVTMGPHVLRVETAALAALAYMMIRSP